MIEIITDVLNDSLPMLPVLFIAYGLIEWYEHRHGEDKKVFRMLESYGPLFGAFFGVVPQCGFSIIASTLYLERKITLGALLSVFIVTSDEAIPILLANPEMYATIGKIILIKIVIAIAVGYFMDIVFSKYRLYGGSHSLKKQHEEHDSILKATISRTLKIFVFILAVNFVLTTLITIIGEDTLAQVLLTGSFFQPIVAALFGFIPNCAASVVLTQLYISGVLSFGSLLSGLITNAGLGLMVLIDNKIEKKPLLMICAVLLVSAVITGSIFSLIS